MAEGFARAYGADVMIPASAGLAPAISVARDTIRAMKEKNIELQDHFPKSVQHLAKIPFDLVINMSGVNFPSTAPMRSWSVKDPVSLSYKSHCEVRDEIEKLVMSLIMELRREPN